MYIYRGVLTVCHSVFMSSFLRIYFYIFKSYIFFPALTICFSFLLKLFILRFDIFTLWIISYIFQSRDTFSYKHQSPNIKMSFSENYKNQETVSFFFFFFLFFFFFVRNPLFFFLYSSLSMIITIFYENKQEELLKLLFDWFDFFSQLFVYAIQIVCMTKSNFIASYFKPRSCDWWSLLIKELKWK